MKKLYLALVEIIEEAPAYTFLIEAENENEAQRKAEIIAERDYGDFIRVLFLAEVSGLEDVRNILLVNDYENEEEDRVEH